MRAAARVGLQGGEIRATGRDPQFSYLCTSTVPVRGQRLFPVKVFIFAAKSSFARIRWVLAVKFSRFGNGRGWSRSWIRRRSRSLRRSLRWSGGNGRRRGLGRRYWIRISTRGLLREAGNEPAQYRGYGYGQRQRESKIDAA